MFKKTKIIIYFLILSTLVFLFFEPIEESKLICENSTINSTVYFCPQEDCMQVLINLTKNSKKIDCAFYDLDLIPLINQLEQSDARLVIDHKNYYDNEEKFENYSGNIKLGTKYIQMHNKFCIFDDEIVATGSFNPTIRGNYKNNNNLVVIHSKYLAKNYNDEFNELWNGINSKGNEVKYPKVVLNGNLIENYFCPEDCNSDIFTDIINLANESVYFMTFSFTKDEIGDALINAHNRGIKVSGVFEKTQNNKWLEKERLESAGIMDVMWDTNSANMHHNGSLMNTLLCGEKKGKLHHKVFIIDEKIVITGSTNPSNNGLNKNDENIIIFHDRDIVKEFVNEFKCIWTRSNY
jgi:phosphatidylserine/phosphatidylglycerophosphate/cardiolipin synthase-like enzyme